MDLFDTHCHLNLAEHFPDPKAEIERAREAGVTRLCVVGIDEPSCLAALELAERHEGVYAIVGWHPNSAASFSPAISKRIEEWLSHPKAVALGEIGLDYHWDFATSDQQKACLLAQLELAQALGKPVVFHCREAHDDLMEILEARAGVLSRKVGAGGGRAHAPAIEGSSSTRLPPPSKEGAQPRYLFHCFSGDASHAAGVRALDGIIGVDGPLTYKKSDALRELVRTWPRDRLVLETDTPYLTPEPFRGKPNHPAHLSLINAQVAACWEVAPEKSARQTTENALRFFRIRA